MVYQWSNGSGLIHAYGFQSREWDRETDLNFHRGRYYNRTIGRWMSQDPIGFAGGDANLNRFVGNSPLTGLDPYGLEGAQPSVRTFQFRHEVVQNKCFNCHQVIAGKVEFEDLSSAQQIAIMAWNHEPSDALLSVYGGIFGGALGVAAVEFGPAAVAGFLGQEAAEEVVEQAFGIPVFVDPVDFAQAIAKQSIKKIDDAAEVAARTYPDGSFSITDWSDYPDGVPRPTGPFRLLEGEEYQTARNAANAANRVIHRQNPSLSGLHLHEIHPVKFGGDPIQSSNKIPLAPPVHSTYTNWWNHILRENFR